MELAYIPSPTRNVWYLGPVPLRAYAIAIIIGIAAAVLLAERRWTSRGGRSGTVADIAVWAVIFGLVGGRLYHVLTDPELYFGTGRHPIDMFKVWEGGLGIWGAVGLGAVGAWLAARRRGISFSAFADAAAPAVAVAQGIGRVGNWFNNELYGQATTQPWGLTVYDIDPVTHHAREVAGNPVILGHFQPTFLYELVWDLAVAGLVIWADRRFRLGRGRAFALYAMAYTLGRVWVEFLRVDHANEIGGVRLNVWTCAVVFLAGLAWFLTHRGPREQEVEPLGGPDRPRQVPESGDHGSSGDDLPADAAVGPHDSDGGLPREERQLTPGGDADPVGQRDRAPATPADVAAGESSPAGGEG